MKMSDERKELFANISKPVNMSQLRVFMGTANYFRDFVANFASIAIPLYDLMKGRDKKMPIVWTEEGDRAFTVLRQAVINAPILFHIQPDGEVTVYTDASNLAVGGFLTQMQNGVERPLIFMSRRLSDAETRYSTIEKEMVGIAFCIKHAHVLLAGRRFLVKTDHKPLVQQVALGDNPRVERLKLSLQEYEYSVT